MHPARGLCSDSTKLTAILCVFSCLFRSIDTSIPQPSPVHAQHATREKVANFPRSPEPEIVLGGLFPVHGTNCGSLNVERGIHRLEAMLFAVDRINRDDKILPNITLGVSAHDTCGTDTVALEESLEFIMEELQRKENSHVNCATPTPPPSGKPAQKGAIIAGVVGAAASGVSIPVASLLRLFQLPQISYASTTPVLSDKKKYDFFVRTVPPDNYQARAMVDIVLALNWSSVFTVHSKGAYGQGGMQEFLLRAKNANICVASKFQFDSDTDQKSLDRIIDDFDEQKNTHGVVLFCDHTDIRRLLEAAKRKGIKSGRFIWIASDYWGTQSKPVKGFEDIAEGAITISLKGWKEAKSQDFVNYFNALGPGNHSKVNPWFDDFWEQQFNCTGLKTNQTTCPANVSLSETHSSVDDFVPFVIDAVYSFAHALHAFYARNCPTLDALTCFKTKKLDRMELLKFLYNVSFDGVTGNVTFNENGNTQGRYDIFRFLRGTYKRVASWEGSLFDYGYLAKARKNDTIPKSQCGVPCTKGSYKKTLATAACCWTCEECDEDKYVKDGSSCARCDSGQRPNTDKDGCEKLPRRKLDRHWIITVMCFTATGMLCTLCVLALFVNHNETPVVKASGRELTYSLLFGLMLCYIVAFLLVTEPSVSICAVQRFGLGFCFSICYSALLIKTNRIARIFEKGERSKKPPNMINPLSQMAILAIFVLIESVLAAAGLVYWPPKATEAYPTAIDVLLICNIQNYDLISALTYNIILIALCTWYAIRTRKTPDNYNEARYIGFAMYTTCIIWVAFLPVQFGVSRDYATSITLSINTTLNATTLLLCIFGPKVYIILFRPTRNKRSRSLSSGWHSETQGKLSISLNEQTSLPGLDNPLPVIQNGFPKVTVLHHGTAV